jgi:hypothetical protein
MVIASGENLINDISQIYPKKCVAKGDYQLTKGIRAERKLKVGKIFGRKKLSGPMVILFHL